MNRLRVLIVSGMWPSEREPDYGAFVRTFAGALAARPGIEVDVAGLTERRSGRLRTPAKYAGLTADAIRRARRSDVVWGHFLFPAGAAAAIAGRLTGRPWVLTAHGGDVANLDRSGVARATRLALRGASEVTAVSDWLATRLAQWTDDGRDVAVVSMGVDLSRFRPSPRDEARAALGLDPSHPLVLAVGGLTERKNPLGLIRALGRLRATGTPARLAFVGDGPLAARMRAEIAALGLDDVVTLAGALPADGVARWMAACDVLALVSRPEPFGVVALEALACGRPVVVTGDGGTPEILAPDPTVGEVVDPGDPGDIGAGITTVLARGVESERCRAVASEHDVGRRAEEMAGILARASGRI